MTKRPRINLAASVRDRLLARSRATGEDFNFLLQRYAAERFLYRLGVTPHRNAYVLKGAMLFALWGGPAYRPTHDVDFTGAPLRGASFANADLTAVLCYRAGVATTDGYRPDWPDQTLDVCFFVPGLKYYRQQRSRLRN